MRARVALVAVLFLAACEYFSQFAGTWQSQVTDARYELGRGGSCDYYNKEGIGLDCEWEPVGDDKAIIRIRMGDYRVPMNAELSDGLMIVRSANGDSWDMFRQR